MMGRDKEFLNTRYASHYYGDIVRRLFFIAGLTNPLQKWVMALNTGISLIGLITFEYHAVTGYDNLRDPLFWINQGLAFIFFFALYYSTKTVRGAILRE